MQNFNPLKRRILPPGAPYMVLVLGLMLTAIATSYVHNDVRHEEKRRFQEITSQIENQITLRLQRFEAILEHTRALFAASDDVTRKDFHEFFASSGVLQGAPGLRGVGYSVRVPSTKLAEHTRKVREQGFPAYSIWPGYPRDDYFTTLYYEPFNWNNQVSIGFDMSTEPIRREAMERARDTGQAAMSAKLKLLRTGDVSTGQTGFLIFVPIYAGKTVPLTVDERREKLVGFVYSPFRTQELFGSIFGDDYTPLKLVQFEIYDGPSPKPEGLFYDSNGHVDFGQSDAKWQSSIAISVHGHSLSVYVSALPLFSPAFTRHAALFVAAVGLIFSLFAFWVLRTIQVRISEGQRRLQEETEARQKTESLASELSHAVAERNYSLDSLEAINKVGQIISAELDLERLMQAVNDAAVSISRAKFGAFFANQLTPEGTVHTLYSISGVPKELFAKFPMPRATQIFSPTFHGTGPVRSDDITRDPRYGKNAPHQGMPTGHLPVRSYLAVPVVSRSGQVLGGLFLGHPERGIFTERDEKSVVSLAAQAAVAVDNARLFKDANEAVAARDDFLSICSHELRTPLTSLKLQTQLTRRMADKDPQFTLSPEKLRHFLSTTNMQVDRLIRLVEDMLDISRIRAGKLSLQPEAVSLRGLVQEVTERFSPQLAVSGSTLSLHLDQDVTGHWDKFRLEQVLVNLLSNAVKYGAGKPIDIYLSQKDGTAILEVADQGIGIQAESQTRIFERFERAVSKQNISGLGLGLFIVRQILEAHGGNISVASELGKGARFIVRLPLDASPRLLADTVRTDTRYPSEPPSPGLSP